MISQQLMKVRLLAQLRFRLQMLVIPGQSEQALQQGQVSAECRRRV
jgi:hypothetical protein